MPPGGEYYILLTRVTEKTGKFTFTSLKEVLARIDLTNVKCLTIWTDRGTHYWTKEYLGSILGVLIGKLRISIKHKTGCEKHSKFEVDSY